MYLGVLERECGGDDDSGGARVGVLLGSGTCMRPGEGAGLPGGFLSLSPPPPMPPPPSLLLLPMELLTLLVMLLPPMPAETDDEILLLLVGPPLSGVVRLIW